MFGNTISNFELFLLECAPKSNIIQALVNFEVPFERYKAFNIKKTCLMSQKQIKHNEVWATNISNNPNSISTGLVGKMLKHIMLSISIQAKLYKRYNASNIKWEQETCLTLLNIWNILHIWLTASSIKLLTFGGWLELDVHQIILILINWCYNYGEHII